MYRVAAALCVLALSTASARASSILTLPESGPETPSIVALGTAEPPTLEGVPAGPEVAGGPNPPRYHVGGSILAFGLDAIPAAPVAVASIDPVAEEEPEEPHHAPLPFVIRGGVIGDAFAAPPAEEVELTEETGDDAVGAEDGMEAAHGDLPPSGEAVEPESR